MPRIEVSRQAAAEVAKLAVIWGGSRGRLLQAEVVDRVLSEWKQAMVAPLKN
jgi:hypothetical protein